VVGLEWYPCCRQHGYHSNKISKWEECGPCPVFASYILAFSLQLRKKHGKKKLSVLYNCSTSLSSYSDVVMYTYTGKMPVLSFFKTITLDLLNNTPHYALCNVHTNIARPLLDFVAFCLTGLAV